jgi:hypothetical protein
MVSDVGAGNSLYFCVAANSLGEGSLNQGLLCPFGPHPARLDIFSRSAKPNFNRGDPFAYLVRHCGQSSSMLFLEVCKLDFEPLVGQQLNLSPF